MQRETCVDCSCSLQLDEYYMCDNCSREQLNGDLSEPLGGEADESR